jgi:hypothetical protein
MNTPMDDWTNAPMDHCAVDNLLRDLPGANPDVARAARTRGRCHQAMTRRVSKRRLESALVGGFCAVYITIGAFIAVHFRGLN